MITGAYEFKPGLMRVDLLDTKTQTTHELIVYTDDYLSCWENGLPVQRPGTTDWWGTSTASYPPLPLNMDLEEKRRRIAEEIEDTYYAYHTFPHAGLIPDWFLRYWDLAEAVCDYFDVPFHKPEKSSPDQIK